MRNKVGNIILGLILVAIGVLYAGNALFHWNFTIFFPGWWTLFIIIPCFVNVVKSGVNAGNAIGLTLGVLLLLGQQPFVDSSVMWSLMIPAILIVGGLAILFGGSHKNRAIRAQYAKASKDGLPQYTAVFSGQNLIHPHESFSGASILAVFGGVDLDLRSAIIDHDIVIRASSVFGGSTIMVPSNVKVVVTVTPVFGGVDNKVPGSSEEGAPTVFVDSTCVFGGVEIR